MPGIDKATGRVIVLVVLVIVAALALRGYLPGDENVPREESTSSSGSFFAVVALLSASMAIIAIAIITRLRDRRTAPATGVGVARPYGGSKGRPPWRFLMIGLGVIIAWLLIVVMLTRLSALLNIDQPPSETESSTAPPTGFPSAPTPPTPSSPSDLPEQGGNMFAYLAATTVTFLLLVAVGSVAAYRRQRRVAKMSAVGGDPAETSIRLGSESLAQAAEVGLAEIGDLSHEPREAIIACYAAMERELANLPEAMPQDFDTPMEVLARAVEHHALRAGSAVQLVDLFEEARFSPHVMSEGHREAAVGALRLVLVELRRVA